jgi:uroporphyrinogen III methyltransferase / synthase
MTVYLVGAGPGDPGLVTVRGAELLARADVVVFDRLAHPALVELAPPAAERVSVGKAPGRVEMEQGDINRLLVDLGREGKTVVRLKGGDPFVFGRGGEEAEALTAAGVAFEVVPGITSAIGAPAYAGIPVTHRGLSTHFTVVTGHGAAPPGPSEDASKGAATVDWEALARVGGTLVVLMGAGRIGEIARQLVAGGRPPTTPVAAIHFGTRPDQRTVRATLATIGGASVQPPSAIVIGEVAASDLTWFEARPLFGRRIVVTRAREQASELRARLEILGAEVVELPSIAIEPVGFTMPPLDGYGWLVLTSANGVHALFDRGLAPAGLDTRALAPVRVAAMGPGTAAALEARGLRPDLVPERFVAEALVDAFPAPATHGERVLLARAEQARDVLPAGLAERGYAVDVLTLYRTVAAEPDPAVVEAVRAGGVDAITFTSSSTVSNFCDIVGVVPEPQPLVASIGPVTSKTAVDRGLRVGVEAEEHTLDGLVAALLGELGARSEPEGRAVT